MSNPFSGADIACPVSGGQSLEEEGYINEEG